MRAVAASLCLVFICVPMTFGKTPEPSPARFTVEVTDEEGRPVADVPVSAGFVAEKNRSVSGMTDSNGRFVAECEKAMSGEVGFTVCQDATGWYETHSGLRFKHIIKGRWEPWNPVVTAIVRRVANPIPMYMKRVETKIPVTNSPCGYDLVIGDWTAPYGRGLSADFVFTIIGHDNGMKDYESHLSLDLKKCMDGIQRLASDNTRSAFLLCRIAPENGYEHTWENAVGYSVKSNGFYETQGGTFADPAYKRWGYAFRVRSVTNERGKIVESFYGKVLGPIIFFNCTDRYLQFTYYLNPTPNDRNMEFDPKRNLFSGNKVIEKPAGP